MQKLSSCRVKTVGRPPTDWSVRRKLPGENGAFTNWIPAIVAENAGLANDAMTRDDEGNRVRADRASNGTRGVRLIDCRREATVISECTDWDTQ